MARLALVRSGKSVTVTKGQVELVALAEEVIPTEKSCIPLITLREFLLATMKIWAAKPLNYKDRKET